MTDCEGDFKCPYCKGDTREAPTETYGACKEAELQDQIRRLTAEVNRLTPVYEAVGRLIEDDGAISKLMLDLETAYKATASGSLGANDE